MPMNGEMIAFNEYNQSLFGQIVSMPSLYQAWRKVRANRGAAGVDAISLDEFEANLTANLRELSRSLLGGAYQPMPARFVTITKDNGKERELGILAVRDRVAQRAVLDAIEPLVEPLLLDCSFAFRPGRNVEMAVQHMIAARANGFWWTVESDVQDFFGSIDRRLLLKEVGQVMPDENVLRLLQAWLDAGALEQGSAESARWRHQGREAVANLKLLMRESISRSVDEYVAERLGVSGSESYLNDELAFQVEEQEASEDFARMEVRAAHQRQTRREAVKRLMKDGALLALSQRAALGRLLCKKLLGVGGLVVAAAVLTPKAIAACRHYFHPRLGTLQGAPLSPLLTNFYMTPFDREMTGRGFRLIRYCDDFVIQCRTEAEAQQALRAAEQSLAGRRLSLHPDKTRVVPPDSEFEFLGYGFASDGRVIPPPSVPEQIASQIRALANRAASRFQNAKGGFRIEKHNRSHS
jgi:RNA-directed DNA polymerase